MPPGKDNDKGKAQVEDTVGDLKTFTLFPCLPKEIQLKIWRACLPAPYDAVIYAFSSRNLGLRFYAAGSSKFCHIQNACTTPKLQLRLLEICRDAREVGVQWLQSNGFVWDGLEHDRPTFRRPFDVARDALYMPNGSMAFVSNDTSDFGLNGRLHPNIVDFCSTPQRIVLSHTSLPRPEDTECFYGFNPDCLTLDAILGIDNSENLPKFLKRFSLKEILIDTGSYDWVRKYGWIKLARRGSGAYRWIPEEKQFRFVGDKLDGWEDMYTLIEDASQVIAHKLEKMDIPAFDIAPCF